LLSQNKNQFDPSKIPEFAKNKNEILNPKNLQLLNFVDVFMNVKCCVEHRQLQKALNATKTILSSNDIPFSLTAGSLLASVREKGFFIPWDTDVDLLIQPENEEAVKAKLFSSSSSSSSCFTKLLDPPRQVDHGKLLGFVYSTPKNVKPHHEESSRVEIWVAREDKKMQKKSVVLPLRKDKRCSLQGISLPCPNNVGKILEAGYGEKWCVACKSKSSNCKK
jgi:hypothetical protein